MPQKSSSIRKPPRSRYSRSFCDLAVGQLPVAHLAGAQPGPVVDVVAIVEIDGLFDGAHRDARQAAQRRAQDAGRRADSPGSSWCRLRASRSRAIAVIAAEARVGMLRIHQTGEDPFGLVLPVRRHGHVVIGFHAAVQPPGPLETVQRHRPAKFPRPTTAHFGDSSCLVRE